jgi:predicted N-acetyltransferase YhbS
VRAAAAEPRSVRRQDLKLDLVDEYALDESQREGIRSLLAACFPEDAYTRTRTYLKQLPPRRLLAYEAGQLVGQLGLEHRAIGTSQGPHQVLGVADLCVSEASRRQGVASHMLSEVESLARAARVPFLVLFARDHRLYERNGFVHAPNPLRWVKIHEHEITGVAVEPLEELMVKAVGSVAWPEGLVDLLGHQF